MSEVIKWKTPHPSPSATPSPQGEGLKERKPSATPSPQGEGFEAEEGVKLVGLRRIREAAGITQTALAEELGVVRATVSSWEVGIRLPSAALLPRIARILGCTIDDLYEEDFPELEPEEEAGLPAHLRDHFNALKEGAP